MAQGDFTLFEEFSAEIGNGIHNLETDVIKCAIITNAVTPTAATATPRLGDFTEVTTTGDYIAGGTDITATYTEAAGTATFDGTTNPNWPQNAGGGTNAYWGLVYNSTDASKRAIGFIQLAGAGAATAVDMTAGDLTITWAGGGIFTLS